MTQATSTVPAGRPTMPAMDVPGRSIALELALDDEALDALERALLRARSAELSEVRRRNVRLTAGYGDATGREVMDNEARQAQSRHDALDAILRALRVARTRDRSAAPPGP